MPLGKKYETAKTLGSNAFQEKSYHCVIVIGVLIASMEHRIDQ